MSDYVIDIVKHLTEENRKIKDRLSKAKDILYDSFDKGTTDKDKIELLKYIIK